MTELLDVGYFLANTKQAITSRSKGTANKAAMKTWLCVPAGHICTFGIAIGNLVQDRTSHLVKVSCTFCIVHEDCPATGNETVYNRHCAAKPKVETRLSHTPAQHSLVPTERGWGLTLPISLSEESGERATEDQLAPAFLAIFSTHFKSEFCMDERLNPSARYIRGLRSSVDCFSP